MKSHFREQLSLHARKGRMHLLSLLLLLFHLGSFAQSSPEYNLGAKFLSDAQYNALPKANWDTLAAYSVTVNKFAYCSSSSAGRVVMLNTPPIGNQNQ